MTERLVGVMESGSGASRAEIRAALHRMQNSQCAVCATPGKLEVDHDRSTGLVRGPLCHSYNVREGNDVDHPDIDAYRASPPAAGLGWLWELPDRWTDEDTANVARLGITIVEYLPQHLELAAAREHLLQQAVMKVVLNSERGRGETKEGKPMSLKDAEWVPAYSWDLKAVGHQDRTR
jgi:hypothetical protein